VVGGTLLAGEFESALSDAEWPTGIVGNYARELLEVVVLAFEALLALVALRDVAAVDDVPPGARSARSAASADRASLCFAEET